MKNYPNYAPALTNKRNSLRKVKEQNVKSWSCSFTIMWGSRGEWEKERDGGRKEEGRREGGRETERERETVLTLNTSSVTLSRLLNLPEPQFHL